MERHAVPQPDDDPHMGSEYADARRYLAQRPRRDHLPRTKTHDDPQHGSNDSDFGMADQRED